MISNADKNLIKLSWNKTCCLVSNSNLHKTLASDWSLTKRKKKLVFYHISNDSSSRRWIDTKYNACILSSYRVCSNIFRFEISTISAVIQPSMYSLQSYLQCLCTSSENCGCIHNENVHECVQVCTPHHCVRCKKMHGKGETEKMHAIWDPFMHHEPKHNTMLAFPTNQQAYICQ